MISREEPDPVQPALRRAEAEVARHLEEACEDIGQRDLGEESLDGRLRLENELPAAARAVDETVRLRRQLGERPTANPQAHASPESPASTAGASAPTHPTDEAPACRLRDF